MLEIIRIGENTVHDGNFRVDRPSGFPAYVLLMVKTTARFLVGDNWQNVFPDTAVLFKPGQQHRYEADSPFYIDSWMHFQADQLPTGEIIPCGVPFALHNSTDYYLLFHILFSEFYGASPNRDSIINHISSALLYKLAGETQNGEVSDLYFALAKIREDIFKYPERKWAVPEIAEGMHISPGHFHTLYQKYFHTTCINDVINSRVQAACDLLMSTHYTIEQTAEHCGYSNTEHFIRQFKLVMGTTPGRYRKQYLQ